MSKLYDKVRKDGKVVFHRNYCLYNNDNAIAFDAGAIRLITLNPFKVPDHTVVNVSFADDNKAEWTTKWIDAYTTQFGVAVSFDGKYIFAQTWENGLFCLDPQTGEKIWRTKSKRGFTNIFVNEDTVLCHQRERALQLLDIHTGEVLEEKCPATAWGFKSLDHNHIICQTTARRWEIIDAGTLETKQVISHRDFTDGHENFCINYIQMVGNEIVVRGFQNVWYGNKMLPNINFEHRFRVDFND